MPKDKLQPLYKLLGEGSTAEALQAGQRLQRELEEEISSKRKQIALIREILAPYQTCVSEDGLTPGERGTKIRQAALALANSGLDTVTPPDVLKYLRDEEGIEFDVKRPASVVGTVLAKMKEFEHAGMGQFRRISAPLAE